MDYTFDVIVIGAGHAGCEAALSTARLGLNTLLITQNLENIALTPCNPSIGGPGKTHLVAEIDALGGEIAKNTERSYIQVRTLNTTKGLAVQAWRAQIDKKTYKMEMRKVLENTNNLTLKQGEVVKIITKNNKATGILTATGIQYNSNAIVLTTGTYMRSFIVIGPKRFSGGPHNQPPSFKLGHSLEKLGFKLRRLQTATPVRVDKKSLDFSKFKPLHGENPHPTLSFFLRLSEKEQLPSYLTFTNNKTIEIINKYIHTSPLVIGNIIDTGPRHCPSIERKVIRFPEKYIHQVFIEPQGYDNDEYYIQGATTAMIPEAQLEILKTLPGFENVKIIRFGYGIEYDALSPSELTLTLESKRLSGLFVAGQINGTSGYEEAAAQGIIAGINAAMKIKRSPPFILNRYNSYIGVLIDDLITKKLYEPYRMYTSRAEFRLQLRVDNAILRLSKFGYKIGLLSKEDYEKTRKYWFDIKKTFRELKYFTINPTKKINNILIKSNSSPLKKSINGIELLSRPESHPELFKKLNFKNTILYKYFHILKAEAVYNGYWVRHKRDIEKMKELDNIKIPIDFDFKIIPGLRAEAKQRLIEIKPINLGQAYRIQGVTPADITILLRYIKKVIK